MTLARIEQLAASVPALGHLLREVRGSGLREPDGPDPLLSPSVSAGTLDEFLSLAVRECNDANIFGLALALPMCAFRRGAGYEALEYCLTGRDLPPTQRDFIAGRMLGAKSVADVVWAHGIVLSTGNTALYHSFLSRHAATAATRCFDQAATYLLAPERGPGDHTARCVELILQQDVGAARPFIRRWAQWLDDGLFDGLPTAPGRPTAERPETLYRILDDNLGRPTFAPLREATVRHLTDVLHAGGIPVASRHLAAVVDARYRGARHLYAAARPAVQALDAPAWTALAPAWQALGTLATSQASR